ncbi:MAG TPA: phage terminase small subunit P27 family [Cyclobacteriaceae bacterium]|nr:phage terminase small subunit P27 family [Cyclobacteriaceae bacterium]
MKGKRTPTKIKQLQSSVNVTRDLKDEVSFSVPVQFPAPSYFGPVGRREWNLITAELAAVGLIETVDLAQLRLYCHNIQIAEDCAEQIKKEGMTTTTTNKGGYSYEVEHPAVNTMYKAIQVVTRIAGKFGFDPASRTKVAAPKKKEEVKDPFEEAVKLRVVAR